MNVFVRVANAGSFAAGARELDISRAMATKHIMSLESDLGTRLFNRTTRSLSLTDVGISYLERCQHVLTEVEEMEAAVTHLQTEPRGLLRISAPYGIGSTHISRAVTEFLKLYPDLTVEMILQNGPMDLVDEGVDVAICLGTLDDSSLVARKVATSLLVACGSPEYFAEHGVPQTPQDLLNHSCLVNWAVAPKDKWRFKTETGYTVINVSGRVKANVGEPVRIAAINGLGVIMLPFYIVGRDIEKGKLKVVLEDYLLPPLDVYAVYPHRKYLSAKVKSFMDFLQEWLEHRVSMPPPE